MKDELKPCPFCGGPAIVDAAWPNTRWYIACCADEDCYGCFVATNGYYTKEQAIELWNKRVAADLEAARAEARREAISQCKAIVDELIEIGEKKRKWLKNEMTLLAEGREP
jgi:hypothetical protein